MTKINSLLHTFAVEECNISWVYLCLVIPLEVQPKEVLPFPESHPWSNDFHQTPPSQVYVLKA